MARATALMRTNTYLFSLVLAVGLVIANVAVLPAFGDPSSYAATLAGLAPFALVAMASTPSILAGAGGIDVSIGPLVGLIGIIYVQYLQPAGIGGPELAIPIGLGIGAAIGALNGALITFARYQPVIATLCMYFVLGGLGEQIMPTPKFAQPGWTDNLAGSYGPIPGAVITIGVPLLIWLFLTYRTSFVDTLHAVGGNDAAALTAGINVSAVRVAAYTLGGVFAALAAFSLTALIRDGDSTIGATYTLVALAAVSLGGTVFGGGRGGLVGALFGAASIYLIQNLLTNLGVSAFWLQIVYGAVLVAAIVLSHRLASLVSEPIFR
jgi:ribose transport system permease protein